MSKIYLSSPHMSDENYEQKFINEAFDTNWIAPLGKNVDEFENEITNKLQTKASVALSSGTAAIHLALKAAGVCAGDIVLCQSLTFSATANPITYINAVPVFIDSDIETWNISPDALERAFKKYPNAKVVIIVHLYGLCAQLDEIISICKKYNAVIIEDSAESLGTKYKGKYTGTFGEYGIISFNGNKIITTSGGGMLLCNGNNAAEKSSKVRFWATQARDPAPYYQHSEIGYNYRLSNVLAGIGRGQLLILDKRIEQKKHIYNFYKKAFENIEFIKIMPIYDWEDCNCWLTVIQLSGKITPKIIIDKLNENQIESRPVWKPMHMQPVFYECDYIDNKSTAENLFVNGLCLPSDTKMTDEDLNKICNIIISLYK